MLKDDRCWGGAGHLAWALSKRSGDDLSGDPMYDACMAGVAPLESDAFEWPGQIDPGLGWPSSALPPEAGLMAQPELVRAIVAKWAARKHALFSDLSTKDEEVLTQAGPNPNPSPNPNPNPNPNPDPDPDPGH